MKSKINQLANAFFPAVVQQRRYLHANPELSFDEVNTHAFIANELKKLNIPFEKVAGNGLLGFIEGKNRSNIIALRADMDALPIQEKNDFDFCSTNIGVMHACGHDMHMASLLGAAKILMQIKDELNGSVKLIFQPAEEKIPGGAKAMIEAGVLSNPDVDFIFGQHVLPELESGKIGLKAGPFMASSDEIYITIKGKGGHAAMPWKLIDPIKIASQLVLNLQQVSESLAPSNIPTVISIGRFIGDGANNVIPEEVKLDGTFRTFDEKWRKQAHDHIRRIATETAEAQGATVEVEIRNGYPSLFNNELLYEEVKKAAYDYLGVEQVEDLDLRMTAEDFAYFAKEKPAVFYRLGVFNKDMKNTSPLHSATFNPDEKALITAIGFMAYLAYFKLLHA
ncbi:MAG: amidohydrolase [Bacteroidetes bacterium]|jgi:amidohydrolase|nr:amidohydrolase [Bacteroidota bacterium]MBT5530485.1 amidohydrolase [Cytophagia bacterium]MBT3423104.1 amidohydrolase [Bacteroidota bacterium]MBT3800426.1 amidohydrolase [Bacteroidota bacterium]MBT3935640.1 amidohydrolase [Bacteroidota bacterium]